MKYYITVTVRFYVRLWWYGPTVPAWTLVSNSPNFPAQRIIGDIKDQDHVRWTSSLMARAILTGVLNGQSQN